VGPAAASARSGSSTHALRNLAIDQKRVLFICEVDRISTSTNPNGRPWTFENDLPGKPK